MGARLGLRPARARPPGVGSAASTGLSPGSQPLYDPAIVTDGTAAFLRRFAPFDAVPEDELAEAADAIVERAYAAGELVLVEDGTPARHLYVVRSGSVELVHEEDVIDVLEPGEAFGHPSLLSGMAPAFDVRAREQTVCLLLDAAVARRVLGSPTGVEFVASSLRERLVRTGQVAHAQADQRIAHLGALVHRPAVECTPADRGRGGSAADGRGGRLVRARAARRRPLRDRDRLRPAAPSCSPAAGPRTTRRWRELMTAPALTFPPERMAVDAMIDMLDARHPPRCRSSPRTGRRSASSPPPT